MKMLRLKDEFIVLNSVAQKALERFMKAVEEVEEAERGEQKAMLGKYFYGNSGGGCEGNNNSEEGPNWAVESL